MKQQPLSELDQQRLASNRRGNRGSWQYTPKLAKLALFSMPIGLGSIAFIIFGPRELLQARGELGVWICIGVFLIWAGIVLLSVFEQALRAARGQTFFFLSPSQGSSKGWYIDPSHRRWMILNGIIMLALVIFLPLLLYSALPGSPLFLQHLFRWLQ